MTEKFALFTLPSYQDGRSWARYGIGIFSSCGNSLWTQWRAASYEHNGWIAKTQRLIKTWFKADAEKFGNTDESSMPLAITLSKSV